MVVTVLARSVPKAAIPSLALALACTAAPPRTGADLQRFEYAETHMGTRFRIVLYAPDAQSADRAARAAFARVAGLDRILSDYDPDSELNSLHARADEFTRPVEVSPELLSILVRANEVHRASRGAFDVTVGPLVRLWRRAVRQGELPGEERLAQALELVDARRVQLDPVARTVLLERPGMRLDFGGIGKGAALDEALATLAAHGLERALVDGGGDVAAGAPPPGQSYWRVEVASTQPGSVVSVPLVHAALASSGDAQRFVEIDGVRYSHIVDPRTGLGLTSGVEVSVWARSGWRADAWASALSVLGSERGAALAEGLEAIEARWIDIGPPPRARRTSKFPAALE